MKLQEITEEYLGSLKYVRERIKREIEVKPGPDIRAIIGPRRAGKTFLMLSRAEELLKRGEQAVYAPLDEPSLRKLDARKLAEIVRKEFPKGKVHLFLDEVQEWKGWDYNLRWLHDVKDFFIYVSGSSSTLQASEIPSRLRGRYTSTLVLPFSFKEVIAGRPKTFRERGEVRKVFDDYFKWGGFPEVWLYRSREKIVSLLETIFYRDIVERFRIVRREEFSDIFYFVLENYSNSFTWNSMRKVLEDQGIKVDTKTLISYIGYMKQAFLLFTLEKFSYSVRERKVSPKKLYLVDVCFSGLFEKPMEAGRKMENLVFLELLRRGYGGLFYYVTKSGKEVDFVVKRGTRIKQIVEVCYEPDLEHKKKLVEAAGILRCKDLLCVTWDVEDKINYKGHEIRFVPLWKWLLEGLHD